MSMRMVMAMPVAVRVSVAVPMAGVALLMRIVPVAIVVPMTMIVFFHRPHLTSVAQMSAYAAVAANMGPAGTITKGPTGRPFRGNAACGAP
jgi:hypothetical protein